MPSNILFVFEGEKTEKQITDNLTKYFINDHESTIVRCVYCNDIYELHKEIEEDEYLDTFVLLKEIPKNNEILASYKRDDFAEIYMFFDYDGHDNLADDDKVKEVLSFFNEETSVGKLYLSYPMVEALKHLQWSKDFKKLKVKAKENIRYKQIVNTEARNELKHISKYSKEIWIELIDVHLKKANYVISDEYVVPSGYIGQSELFLNQIDKYINVDATVAVLSSFPLFLFDYYGYNYISKLIACS